MRAATGQNVEVCEVGTQRPVEIAEPPRASVLPTLDKKLSKTQKIDRTSAREVAQNNFSVVVVPSKVLSRACKPCLLRLDAQRPGTRNTNIVY